MAVPGSHTHTITLTSLHTWRTNIKYPASLCDASCARTHETQPKTLKILHHPDVYFVAVTTTTTTTTIVWLLFLLLGVCCVGFIIVFVFVFVAPVCVHRLAGKAAGSPWSVGFCLGGREACVMLFLSLSLSLSL